MSDATTPGAGAGPDAAEVGQETAIVLTQLELAALASGLPDAHGSPRADILGTRVWDPADPNAATGLQSGLASLALRGLARSEDGRAVVDPDLVGLAGLLANAEEWALVATQTPAGLARRAIAWHPEAPAFAADPLALPAWRLSPLPTQDLPTALAGSIAALLDSGSPTAIDASRIRGGARRAIRAELGEDGWRLGHEDAEPLGPVVPVEDLPGALTAALFLDE